MGWRIIKQPNGLFAKFSGVVDNFTHVNMTRKQTVELLERYWHTDSMVSKKITEAENDLNRWVEAINTVEMVHGVADAYEWVKIGEKCPISWTKAG